MLIFIICKCSQYALISRTKKQIKDDLKNPGSYGLKKSENLDFDYIRNSLCSVCGNPAYFKLGYQKKHIYNWACDQIAKELQTKA